MANMFSKILVFTQKLSFYYWQENTVIFFPLKWRAHFVHFQENVCQISKSFQIPNRHSLSFVISSKNGVPCKKQLVHLAPQSHKCFSSTQYLLVCCRNAVCSLPVLSHKDQDLIKWIIFTASSRTFLNETGYPHPTVGVWWRIQSSSTVWYSVLPCLIPGKAPAVSAHCCFYSAMVNLVPKASNISVLWK